MWNKRGQMTIFMVMLMIACIFTAIGLLVMGIFVIKLNNALDQDIDLGQVNLAEVNSQTFGIYTTTFLNNVDWWGLSIIFGMILGLFLSAYFLRDRFPKWGFILDIFIILACFIISLYISSAYITLLNGLSDAGEPFLETYTPKTSLFIKNLPVFSVIIGVVLMVLFHSSIPRRNEEYMQEGGILQGV